MKQLQCPRCGGPAVRLAQGGSLSCVKQCDERLVDMARRVTLEAATADIARRLKGEMPDGVGFCLVLFNFGSEGSMAFASTGQRADTKAMLRELLDKMESDHG